MDRQPAQALWETALGELELQLTPVNFNTWLRDTAALSFDGTTLTVAAPSDFAREWLETRLRQVVVCVLSRLTEARLDVRFVVPAGGSVCAPATPAPAAPASDSPPALVPPCASPALTFETFIPGEENLLAYNAARDIAGRADSPFSPLVLHGPPGIGKTHLLHAIANAAGGARRTVLATTERFVNDFVRASQDHAFDRFRERYRSCDLLILDDFQCIEGKPKSEEEFFHTFNALHEAGRQIVLAMDRTPTLLTGVAERLRSRLHWGLVADMHPPTRETRLEIILRRAAAEDRTLPEEVVAFLADQPAASVRDVHGVYNRLSAFLAIHRGPVTVDVAANAVSPFGARPLPVAPSPSAVIQAVSDHFSLRPADLCGPARGRQVTYARHLAMYLLKEDLGRPVTDIGRLLGGRDHSTVIYGCDRIAKELAMLPQTKADLEALRRRLASPAA